MLDYRFHYAQLVIEDRLRQHRATETSRPALRVHRREPQRPAPTTTRR
ncbi:MAG: hypothetical protein ACRDFZ_02915 [Candidatus Limnocylindria bacterium]